MSKKDTFDNLAEEVERLKSIIQDKDENERRLRNLVKFSNDSFIVSEYPGGKILDVNQNACECLGYTYEELTGMSIRDIDPSSDQRKYKRYKKNELYVITCDHIKKDGTTFPVEIKTCAFRSNGNRQILSIIRDISDQKIIEDELKESEERYRTIFEHIGFGTVLIDAVSGKPVAFNRKTYEDLGYTREEYQNLTPANLTYNYDPERAKSRIKELLDKGSIVYKTQYKRKDGKIRNYLVSSVSVSIAEKQFFQHIRIDITDFKKTENELQRAHDEMEERVKKRTIQLEKTNDKLKREIRERERAEEILRLSEDKFSRAFQLNPNLMAISTLKDGRFVDVNESFIRINGFTREETIDRTSSEMGLFDDPEDRERIRKILKEKRSIRDFEIDMRIKSGELMKGSFSAEIINIDGQECVLSAVDDITERKKAEDALKESEERYRDLFEKSPVATSLLTLGGKLIAGNQTMANLMGYGINEIKGLNLFDSFVDQEDKNSIFENLQRNDLANNLPVRLRRKNNEIIDVLLTVSKVHQADGEQLFQLIGIDVTERTRFEKGKKKLEIRLHQAERMDAIATLAGGIAHQFNNALSTIIGNIELLNMDLSDNKNIPKYVKPIKESVFRMTHLTDQLLAYARGGKYQPKILLLSDFVRDTLPLIKHTIKPSVNIETDLPNNISYVQADITQMQMVLSAIISNSSEAINGNGRIRVSCKDEEITVDNIKDFPGLLPGKFVSLSIEDDGRGMDETTRNRVFEPFFSTKFHGRGLEMAAVYGIIKNHGGKISIESEESRGTKTTIFLPIIEAPVSKTEKKSTERLIKGSGTILVVEDEDTVLDISHAMLERLGYHVLTAKTGDEAFNIAKEFEGVIDLAILDIVLPDMDGKRIYPLLKEIRPEMKVIVCSGYSSEGPAQEILRAGAQAFIQKPFSIAKLSESIKNVLSEGKDE